MLLIHYGELYLKTGHRSWLESLLVENCKDALARAGIDAVVRKQRHRLTCTTEHEEEALAVLEMIPGIQNIFTAQETQPTPQALFLTAQELFKELPEQRISFVIKRSDKSFPLTSQQIKEELGGMLTDIGKQVDYRTPELTVFIEITHKNAFVSGKKTAGIGGLPIGASGKVLSLFSGGIDSPVASFLLMKRGCRVDFIHYYAQSSADEVKCSKIMPLIKTLNTFQGPSKLFLVPTAYYELFTEGKKKSDIDVVLFRNFMIRVAERLRRGKYQALVMGDSIGQVLSQTIKNIKAASDGARLPIFRPLLTYNKEEIITLAKIIGAHDESIKPYKDCCSLIATKQNTAATVADIKESSEQSQLDEVIQKTLQEIVIIEVGSE